MLIRLLTVLFATAFVAGCATTQSDRGGSSALEPRPVTPAPERVSVGEYLEFLDSLADAAEHHELREFNARERAALARIDGELRSRLESVDNIDELNHEQKIAVFNLHEELQAVVIGNPRYQVICRREQTVGTNFRRTTCLTVEEFQQLQDRGQDLLRQAWRYMEPLG